jgi:hypothetical protein
MRGVAFVAAVTVVAEVGDFTRFDHPRQVMAYETVHILGGATDWPGRGGPGERDEVADRRGTGWSGWRRPVP